MISRILPIVVASLAVLAVTSAEADACCGPNNSAGFFRHQYHAFKRGHVPGYLHHRSVSRR